MRKTLLVTLLLVGMAILMVAPTFAADAAAPLNRRSIRLVLARFPSADR